MICNLSGRHRVVGFVAPRMNLMSIDAMIIRNFILQMANKDVPVCSGFTYTNVMHEMKKKKNSLFYKRKSKVIFVLTNRLCLDCIIEVVSMFSFMESIKIHVLISETPRQMRNTSLFSKWIPHLNVE